MNKNYSYDVAFSCAEEDIGVARKIAECLRERKISYYLYTEHTAEHWGNNIFRISMDKYGAEARYVLMLISDTYIRKHWSDIERQIAQTVNRVGDAYILPLLLSEKLPAYDGSSSNIMYVKWQDNPGEVAELIGDKISKAAETNPSGDVKTDKGELYKSGIQEFIKKNYQSFTINTVGQINTYFNGGNK